MSNHAPKHEEVLLRKLWFSWVRRDEIAKIMNISPGAVSGRVARLGLPDRPELAKQIMKENFQARNWTADELLYVKQHHTDHPKQLAKHLNRSEKSIQTTLCKLRRTGEVPRSARGQRPRTGQGHQATSAGFSQSIGVLSQRWGKTIADLSSLPKSLKRIHAEDFKQSTRGAPTCQWPVGEYDRRARQLPVCDAPSVHRSYCQHHLELATGQKVVA